MDGLATTMLDDRLLEISSPRERCAASTVWEAADPPRVRALGGDDASAGVAISPGEIVRRQVAVWPGIAGEAVQTIHPVPFVCEFRSRLDVLIVYETGARIDGRTSVDGAPPSSQRDLAGKVSFVPAGARFREQQTPRSLLRAIFLFIDPRWQLGSESAPAASRKTPRLFFENAALWQTARKLGKLIEAGGPGNCFYGEALGVVLAHELDRFLNGMPAADLPSRGGLSSFQRKRIAHYIDENLAQPIALDDLAEIARLSRCHFARAFKQSFGMPPHRYHLTRRIERAKTLLANPQMSITKTALDLGFSESSAFATTFHKLAGKTPSDYRRSLV
jgi:AraC family transcriptional regulator